LNASIENFDRIRSRFDVELTELTGCEQEELKYHKFSVNSSHSHLFGWALQLNICCCSTRQLPFAATY